MQTYVLEQGKQEMSTKFSPWIVCFAAALIFFYEFIQGNMFASIANHIMRDFGIEVDKMTYLSSSYYVANVLFLFVAGILLDRFSTKKIILAAMTVCVLSTFLLAWSQSFYSALFARFVMGIGSAFCFLGPIRIASFWFPARRMALVTGAIVTMAMSGGMVSQYPLTVLVGNVGWREALFILGYSGLGMLLLMLWWIKDKPLSVSQQGGERSILATMKQAYFNTQTLRAAAYTSLMNMPVAVFGAMAGTLYLVQRLGVQEEQAAMVNTVLFLGAIVGGPLIGFFSDRLGRRVLPMKIVAITSLVLMLGVLYLPVSWGMMAVLFFLLGLFTAGQVISYALVAESNPPEMTAVAVSVVSILTQGGYILYQNAFALVLKSHGGMQMIGGVPVYSLSDYQTAAAIFPIGLVFALLLIMKLKETYCRGVE